MRTRRIITIMLIVIAAIVLIDSGVRLTGYATMVSGGITIHTEAEEERMQAPAEVTFSYDVLAPPLCSTTCNARLVRHDTLETIAEQNTTAIHTSITGSISAESSLRSVPVQLVVSCETRQNRYCGAASERASDIAIVDLTLDEQDTRARAELIGNREALETRFSEELALTASLRELVGPYAYIAELADTSYENEVLTFIESIDNENYAATVPQTPRAIIAWREEQAAYERAQNLSRSIAERLSTLSRYRPLLAEDRAGFDNLTRTYTQADASARGMLAAFEDIGTQLTRVEDRYADTIITRSMSDARETQRALTAACRIYASDCPNLMIEASTIEEADTLMREACTLARSYDPEENKAALAQELGYTLDHARAYYNVSELENSTGFAAFEQATIRAARERDVSLTITERLAITVPTPEPLCTRNTYETREIMIPALEERAYTVKLTIPEPKDCALGDCETRTAPPILLIHGHSFSEGSDPTANMQTMTELGFALEEHGYLYAGHLFPSTRTSEQLSVPLAFTATYYVNSYIEEGTIRNAAFKSEPIESYALRLREDIEEAKAMSGSDTVILVAHSMGGLVSRSYLDLFGDESVEALIMIGTPNHGVTARTQQLCPIFGAGLECRDMTKGSVFLQKLNARPLPEIPMHLIAGTGCDEGDGIVALENALLTGVDTTIIEGSCSGLSTLHGELIEPSQVPETVDIITSIIDDTHTGASISYTRNLLE